MLASQLRHQITLVIFLIANQTLVSTDITCQYLGHLPHIPSRNPCLRSPTECCRNSPHHIHSHNFCLHSRNSCLHSRAHIE